MKRVDVLLQVSCPALDAEGVAQLARTLRNEILTASVDSVRLAASPAAAGAKAGETVAVGALVVALAPIAVESFMGVVASWLGRQPTDVEIEVDGHRLKARVTTAQRDELVDALLRRFGNRS